MVFDYIIENIKSAAFSYDPFKHVYITNFLSSEHFASVTASPEINLKEVRDDSELFDVLFEAGYKIIDFPGCVVDKSQYIKWHRERRIERSVTSTACEGFGMTLRLTNPTTPIISDLHAFLVGDQFRDVIADKFGIDLSAVFPDSGIQKYLDGYEISPHPDIRKKALTYMVNINPHADAETLDHHTHYLTFREPYKYVQAFWEGNENKDRCWVPWDWCETRKQQTENNSIVIFSPSNNTVHAVKSNYDHLKAQRTQLYGNLWYHHVPVEGAPHWEDFVVGGQSEGADRKSTAAETLKALIPTKARDFVKQSIFSKLPAYADPNVIPDRLKQD